MIDSAYISGICAIIAAIIVAIIGPLVVKKILKKSDPDPQYPKVPVVITPQFPEPEDQNTTFRGTSLQLSALLDPDNCTYGSIEYYKALSQRLALSKERETRILLKEGKK